MARLVFFSANDGVHGTELWVTDGTPAGTRLVKDINTHNDTLEVFRGSNPQWLTDLGDGRVIFRAKDDIFGGRDELWISDGTAAGTAMIRDVGGSAISSEPSGITRLLPGLVVYSANNGTTDLAAGHVGRELWVSDGTYAGTRLLADINPGLAGSNPVGITAIGYGLAVFAADNGASGRELWVTNGTAAGTRMLADIRPGTASGLDDSPIFHALGNGKALFYADNGVNGRELWVTDGTAGGTHLLRDLVPGAGGTTATSFAALPDGRVAVGGTGFVTDGTLAGTDAPGESDRTSLPMPAPFTWDPAPGEWAVTWAADGGAQLPDGRKIFEGEFLQLDASGNLSRWASDQLMVSDGTQAGTRPVFDPAGTVDGPYVTGGFTVLPDGRVAFSGEDGWTLRRSLWVTDGTQGGTVILSDDVRGMSSAMRMRDGAVIFTGAAQSDGKTHLWVTDGTAGGTRVLAEGVDSYQTIYTDAANGRVLLGDGKVVEVSPGTWSLAYDIWVTDGTLSGTRLLQTGMDLANLRTESITPLGTDKVVFNYYVDNGGTSLEPWALDLDTGALTLLKDILPGTTSSNPQNLTQVAVGEPIPIPVSNLFDTRVSMEQEVSSFDLDDYFTNPVAGDLRYAVTDLPTTIAVDPVNNTVTTAPTVAPGTYEVTVAATNLQGGSTTASFDWTVVDTGKLRISSTGEWTRATATGPITSTAGSIITVGHKDGAAQIFRIEGGSATIADGKLAVKGKLFSAQVATDKPLMEGEFTVDMATLAITGFKDENKDDDHRLVAGLIEMTFADLVLNPDRLTFRTDLTFDDVPGVDLGVNYSALSTTGAPLAVTFGPQGVDFGASIGTGNWLPEPVEFTLPGTSSVTVGFSNIGIDYEAASDAVYLNGKASLAWGGELEAQYSFIGGDREQSLTIDLYGSENADNLFERGDKFVRIGAVPGGSWTWDVVGEITYADKYEGEIPAGSFLVKELKLGLDTIENTFTGGFTATIPWAFKTRDITASIGAGWEPARIDSFSFGIDKLNAPMGTTGIFVQGGSLGVEGLGTADPDAPITYKAEITATWGADIDVLPSPIHGSISGQIKGGEFQGGIGLHSKVGYFVPDIVEKFAADLIEYFGVTPSAVTDYSLFELGATGTIDFGADSLTISGDLKMLNGTITGTGTLRGFYDYDKLGEMSLAGSLTGTFTVPKAYAVIGGRSLTGNAVLAYTADGNDANDHVSAWTQVTIPLGITSRVFAIGAQLNFDGSYKMLGRKDIPKVASWDLDGAQDVVILSAQWETASDTARVEVIDPEGNVIAESAFAAHGGIALVGDLNDSTSRHVVLENPAAGRWDIRVVDPAGLGTVTYSASEMQESAVARVAAVTQDAAAGRAQMTVAVDTGAAQTARVVMFAADATGQTSGIELAVREVSADGSFTQDIPFDRLGPGTWYLYTRTEADGLAPAVQMHASPLVITGAADPGVTIRQGWFAPTGVHMLILRVENSGDRASAGGKLVLEVPAGMLGGTAIPGAAALALTTLRTELALRVLAPGEVQEFRFALPPGAEGLADPAVATLDIPGFDADTQNNTVTYVLREEVTGLLDQYLRGTLGADLLVGAEGHDTLDAWPGNDTLRGMDGDDLLYGGFGNDILEGGDGDDVLYAGDGDDFLNPGPGNDTVHGGAGNDSMWGALAGEGDDLVYGGDGNDNIWSGAGNDTLYGGLGNDTLGGGAGDDLLDLSAGGQNEGWGGDGNDTILGADLADNLGGAGGDDLVNGGAGNDTVTGAAGNDTVSGGAGDDLAFLGAGLDVFYGSAGNDRVTPGAGYDRMWGGTGADTFQFWRGFGWNRVEDFNPGESDQIALAQGMWFATDGVLTEDQVVTRFGRLTAQGDAILDFALAGTTVVLVGAGTLDGLADHISIF